MSKRRALLGLLLVTLGSLFTYSYLRHVRRQAAHPFAFFDRNGDGRIGAAELGATMRALGLRPTERQLHDLVSQLDHQGKGHLDREAFTRLFCHMLSSALRSEQELAQLEKIEADDMVALKTRLEQARQAFAPSKPIRHVVLLVVVAEELAPVLERFGAQADEALTAQLLGLANAYTAHYQGLRLTVLQVAHSSHYCRHYSGFSQSAAIAALAARLLRPQLLISFGTCGGVLPQVQIGDALLASGCVFVDRIRTSSKHAFDWGVFGGPTLPTPRLCQALGLRQGLVGSQVSYEISQVQGQLMKRLGVVALDMEAAAEAQILMQTGTNFLAIKVISNGIYPGEADRMESEYQAHKATVSAKAVLTLERVLAYVSGRRPDEL